jgi:acyl-CoA dehydrogenase
MPSTWSPNLSKKNASRMFNPAPSTTWSKTHTLSHAHTYHPSPSPRADPVLEAQIGSNPSARWDHHPPIIDKLKARARAAGLWNMFLPKGHYAESPGYTNLEYALMAEWLGRSRCASEAVNCAAPDTGNMEVLAKYGDEAQKRRWLVPLMEGEIRSAFLMTEPAVASSDARNIRLEMRREGDFYVLNGEVWTIFLLWFCHFGTPSFSC